MRFLLACLVGLLLAVEATPVSPPVVSGQVRLSDGSPVVGAQVVLFDVTDLGPRAGGTSHHRRGRPVCATADGGCGFGAAARGWAGAELSQSV